MSSSAPSISQSSPAIASRALPLLLSYPSLRHASKTLSVAARCRSQYYYSLHLLSAKSHTREKPPCRRHPSPFWPKQSRRSLKPSFKRSSLPSICQFLCPPCPHPIHASPCSPHCLSIPPPSITPHVVTHHANCQRRSHSRRSPRALNSIRTTHRHRCLFGPQPKLDRCLTTAAQLPT